MAARYVAYYAVRLVKNGPRVPLKIACISAQDPETGEDLDRSPVWRAWRNGDEVDIFHAIIDFDGLTMLPVVKGETIDEREYEHLLRLKQWAEKHAPDAPEANPRRPIDLGRMPSLF
jgi:hypothetical protein